MSMKMTMAEFVGLKPCPFCGGKASNVWIPYIGGGGYGNVIECDDCWAKTGYYKTEAEAIQAWNTRAATTVGRVAVEVVPTKRTCRMVQIAPTISEGIMQCSECGVYLNEPADVNYCPMCGAKVVS